jgi:hypothetical protein
MSIALQDDSLGILFILDEGALVEVLRAALPAKVLAALASTSRQLCSLARSRVPFPLSVSSPEHAQLVLVSDAAGRPPFSGCEELELVAGHASDCLLAAGVLTKAQHWPELYWLELTVDFDEEQLAVGRSMDVYLAALMSPVVALQQLRGLDLRLPSLGPCTMGHIGQLVQLTRLELDVSEAAAAAAAGNQLGLPSLSALTALKYLTLNRVAAVQPAADLAGPFCLPSSLTALVLTYGDVQHPDPLACWLTHLPGCPKLEELEVIYGPQQHASTHPLVLVRLLSHHNKRVRLLAMYHDDGVSPVWGAAVPGLPDAAAPAGGEWHPGPALAALKGLEELSCGHSLSVREEAHWQHLAQLTALIKLASAAFSYTPALPAGTTLVVLQLQSCRVHLGGHGLGCLLLACPQLEAAGVTIAAPLVPTTVGCAGAQLQPHPKLSSFSLSNTYIWGSTTAPAARAPAAAAPAAAAAAAAAAPAAAAPPALPAPTGTAATIAHVAALAPVLRKVSSLGLYGWPASSSSSPAVGALPDLSSCTALTQLVFGSHVGDPGQGHPEQEQFLSMLRPLGGTLQRLVVHDAPRLNAQVALALQSALPQLQYVGLVRCGQQLLLLPAGDQSQQHRQVVDSVQQLLRPGLVLQVW